MHKSLCLAIIFIIIFQNLSYCQLSPEQINLARNEMKYWKMRGRLTGDENNLNKYSGFLRVGDQQGQSIPFAVRKPLHNGHDNALITIILIKNINI
jgi:hypothetical protein